MGRSSEPIPVSSPHNLKINSGNISQEDMIKDTRHGLLIGRLWYTYAVNPIKGDFSCTARSGIRIIENGQIVNPGRSVRIIHNLPVMLKNISEIGNNQRSVIQWASLPSITPSIKVENITVNSI
jgi:PmbA protein